MIKASFGLSQKGSVREENQDSYLLDERIGVYAVADGLGGLPYGDRASRMSLSLLQRKLQKQPNFPLADLLLRINEETRSVGYDLDVAGFGSTLTMARVLPETSEIQIGHIGDSAAYLVRRGDVRILTIEHTVAARMMASQFEEAYEEIPASAHHTLTQCIGQDLYIDPQVSSFPIQPGDRLFLFTDGVTKPLPEKQLCASLLLNDSLEKICQNLTFRIEVLGSPDNYTIVAVEF